MEKGNKQINTHCDKCYEAVKGLARNYKGDGTG